MKPWFFDNSHHSLLSYVVINKTDIIETLLICISKLADILDKKTTGIASWASNSCTISDKITVEKLNIHRYQTHFEIHIQFHFSPFHYSLGVYSFMGILLVRSKACD